MLNCASKPCRDVIPLTFDPGLKKFCRIIAKKFPPDFPDGLESTNLCLSFDADMLRSSRHILLCVCVYGGVTS